MARDAKHNVIECFWINAHEVGLVRARVDDHILIHQLLLVKVKIELGRFRKFLLRLVGKRCFCIFDETAEGFVFGVSDF